MQLITKLDFLYLNFKFKDVAFTSLDGALTLDLPSVFVTGCSHQINNFNRESVQQIAVRKCATSLYTTNKR